MKYNWNIDTILAKVAYLKKLLQKEANINKVNLILQDIELLESYIIEQIEIEVDDTPSLLDCYDCVKEELGDNSIFWEDIREFSKLDEINLNTIPDIKRSNLSKDDILSLSHDFYKSLNPFFFNNFMRHFKDRKDHLIFKSHDLSMPYTGYSLCISSQKEAFIEIDREFDVEDVLTTIHEYAHATSCAINPYHLSYEKNSFVEIDTLFMELIANDYLKKVTRDKNLDIVKAANFDSYLAFAWDITDLIKIIEEEEKFQEGYTTNKELKKGAANIDITGPEVDILFYEYFDNANRNIYIENYLFALELYNIYKQDKDKALYLLKKFILLKCNSKDEYYSNIHRLGLVPNLCSKTFQTNLKLELKKDFPIKKVAKKH